MSQPEQVKADHRRQAQVLKEQHAQIIALADEASSAAGRNNTEDLHRLLDALHRQLNDHFTDEEHLLQQLDFEGLAEHCESHIELAEQCAELLFLVATRHASPEEVVKVIEGPVKDHFTDIDSPVDDFIRSEIDRN